MINAVIESVCGRRVWDSRGRPTVEAEVRLTDGSCGRAIAPAGVSRGRMEAVELRDGGMRFGGMDVTAAVAAVNGPIAGALTGRGVVDQRFLDDRMRELDGTPDKSHLGGNAIVAVSLACVQAAAAAAGQPLWQYLANGREVCLPVPEIQIFGGGAHAARRIDIQDLMVICPSAPSFEVAIARAAEVYLQAGHLMRESGRSAGAADEGGWWPNFDNNGAALEMMVRSIEAAGLIPGDDVHISLDIAASDFFDGSVYRLALEDRSLDRDEMVDLLSRWLDRYPILSLEDPLAEDDTEGMQAFTAAYGKRVQIVGDDLLVTHPERVRRGIVEGWCNAALIKVNQVGTVSEAFDSCRLAQEAGWGAIVSTRSGDSEDPTIVHLATGWNAGQLKVGSFSRSERMAKWNEMLRIEESLGDAARYAGWYALPRDLERTR